MSKKRIKKLRIDFEKKYGFVVTGRGGELYKTAWRKYKKAVK